MYAATIEPNGRSAGQHTVCASLGHTCWPRHAGPLTVLIYMLINVGAALRVFG